MQTSADEDPARRIGEFLTTVTRAERWSRAAASGVAGGLAGAVAGVVLLAVARPSSLGGQSAALALPLAAAVAGWALALARVRVGLEEAALDADRFLRLQERLLTAAEWLPPRLDARPRPRSEPGGPLVTLVLRDAAARLPDRVPPQLGDVRPPRLLPGLGLAALALIGVALLPPAIAGPVAPLSGSGPAEIAGAASAELSEAADDLERGRPHDPRAARLARQARQAAWRLQSDAGRREADAAATTTAAELRAMARRLDAGGLARLETLLARLDPPRAGASPSSGAGTAGPAGASAGPVETASQPSSPPGQVASPAAAGVRKKEWALGHPYWPRARDAVVRAYFATGPLLEPGK
ncbi:MAG: hypothetical protein HYZ53_07080 [Planctomycetes bacterium]|nr:hypothetical protein [Planctomycetota bacterium]